MTTNTQAGDEELNHIEDMIVAYGRLPTQSNRKRIMQLIKSKQLEARLDERNKGHWYAGTYGRDQNGFEKGYRCNCGFIAENKSTIHSHVDWRKAELQANKGDN